MTKIKFDRNVFNIVNNEEYYNLVNTIFGNMSIISRIIYALVGISGLWGIKLLFDD